MPGNAFVNCFESGRTRRAFIFESFLHIVTYDKTVMPVNSSFFLQRGWLNQIIFQFTFFSKLTEHFNPFSAEFSTVIFLVPFNTCSVCLCVCVCVD